MKADTLLALEKAGLPPVQARTIVEAMETEVVAHIAALATKSDLAELRLATKVDMAELRGHLEVKIESVKSDLVRWVFVCILGQTAAVLAWATFYVNHGAR
jgi:hypothetical protein